MKSGRHFTSSLALIAGLLLAGCAETSPDGDQDRSADASGDSAVKSAALVIRFEAQDVPLDSDALETLAAAASQPHVARLDFERGDAASVSGMLVFQSMEDFATWRADRMASFFNEFGEGARITSLRVMRPEELRTSSASGSSYLTEGVNVVYRNTGNESEGDADIDAVTVICGDGADCQPSN